MIFLVLALYMLGVLAYVWFSFGLTDPNLLFSQWPPFVTWQTAQSNLFFANHSLTTNWYVGILVYLFLGYLILVKLTAGNSSLGQWWTKQSLGLKIGLIALFLLPYCLANNALSHDIYNYIFNAKMVLIYQANPHLVVAQNFSQDLWLRFMHNVHTPAPYGYGWTFLSLIPAILAGKTFLGQWLTFKLFSLLSIGLSFWALNSIKLSEKKQPLSVSETILLFLNPMVGIELLGNGHNDWWMMGLALWSVWAALQAQKLKFFSTTWIKYAGLSLILLAISISIKFASVVLLPLIGLFLSWSLFANSKFLSFLNFKWILSYWPQLSAGLFFITLLTDRSKRFLPWYWSWVLVFIVFIPQWWLRCLIICFSIGALTRYLPWLWQGEYSVLVEERQLLITWGVSIGLFILAILCKVGWDHIRQRKNK